MKNGKIKNFSPSANGNKWPKIVKSLVSSFAECFISLKKFFVVFKYLPLKCFLLAGVWQIFVVIWSGNPKHQFRSFLFIKRPNINNNEVEILKNHLRKSQINRKKFKNRKTGTPKTYFLSMVLKFCLTYLQNILTVSNVSFGT